MSQASTARNEAPPWGLGAWLASPRRKAITRVRQIEGLLAAKWNTSVREICQMAKLWEAADEDRRDVLRESFEVPLDEHEREIDRHLAAVLFTWRRYRETRQLVLFPIGRRVELDERQTLVDAALLARASDMWTTYCRKFTEEHEARSRAESTRREHREAITRQLLEAERLGLTELPSLAEIAGSDEAYTSLLRRIDARRWQRAREREESLRAHEAEQRRERVRLSRAAPPPGYRMEKYGTGWKVYRPNGEALPGNTSNSHRRGSYNTRGEAVRAAECDAGQKDRDEASVKIGSAGARRRSFNRKGAQGRHESKT